MVSGMESKNCPICGSKWFEDFGHVCVKCDRDAEEIYESLYARLQVIVDKLPKCWRLNEEGKLVKDWPVVPGKDKIWLVCNPYTSRRPIAHVKATWRNLEVDECYSTKAAAEAAKGGE